MPRGRVALDEAEVRRRVLEERAAELERAAGLEAALLARERAVDLGRKRVIQRRFNVAVPRARVRETTIILRDRSER